MVGSGARERIVVLDTAEISGWMPAAEHSGVGLTRDGWVSSPIGSQSALCEALRKADQASDATSRPEGAQGGSAGGTAIKLGAGETAACRPKLS